MTYELRPDGHVRDGNDTSFILTVSGRKFWPLAPRPCDVVLNDIAHALSNQCRYTGHTRFFYSVAEHSVLVSRVVPTRFALRGLLHDGSEAYICDLARPVKHHPAFTRYKEVEGPIQAAVYEAFGLAAEDPRELKAADDVVLGAEVLVLMPTNSDELRAIWAPYTERAASVRVIGWQPGHAAREFLARYQEIAASGVEQL